MSEGEPTRGRRNDVSTAGNTDLPSESGDLAHNKHDLRDFPFKDIVVEKAPKGELRIVAV